MNPTDRWNDDRLDELAVSVHATRDGLMRLAILENRLEEYSTDLHDCKTGIDRLHSLREEERKDREKAREEARRERKRDLWAMVGAIFTAATLVVAALGVFLG
jgi:outer membrane murein-binding lipoprotein Lpp